MAGSAGGLGAETAGALGPDGARGRAVGTSSESDAVRSFVVSYGGLPLASVAETAAALARAVEAHQRAPAESVRRGPLRFARDGGRAPTFLLYHVDERQRHPCGGQREQRADGAGSMSPAVLTTMPPTRDPKAMPALNDMGCSDAENVTALG